MELLLHSGTTLAVVAASALFSACWEGAVLAVCVLVCLRIFPNLSAAARSVVWMNVFLLLVLLQVIPFLGVHGSGSVAAHPAALQLDLKWGLAIAVLWAGLSLLRAAQLIVSALRLSRLARRAVPVQADGETAALLRIRTVGIKAGRSAELCTSDEVERPSVLGFLRPRILLPPDLLKRLTPAEIEQVVLHEMEHLRRGDDWTNLLQKLALTFFPLNPALLWVEHRLCAERELACDDSVLRSSCGRKAYAICLTRLAEHAMLRRSLSLALGAWERQSELVRRVHRILRRPGRAMSRRQTVALTGSLILGVLACTLGLARSPQLVGFASPNNHTMAQVLPPLPFPETNAPQAGLPAHIQMVKAMMAQQPLENRPSSTRTNPATTVQKNVALRRKQPRYAASQRAWIVMTGWSDMEALPQMLLTVAPDNSAPRQRINGMQPQFNRISYAAVRLPDGWLIVEI
jgi:beta-lactamase regulating signal transducer with metallopeptidase domain